MHRILLLNFILLGWLPLLGQEVNPCGTTEGPSRWLKNYQTQPDAYAKGGDTTLYVALTIHITGDDNGGGYYRREALLDAFCKLNADYAPAGIQFFIAGEVLYHDNFAYHHHNTFAEGVAMMYAENVPNTLNIYFVEDPAGNCGYSVRCAGIANKKTCSGETDYTWAHEIGHSLSLPHPFYGWESGVAYDGSVEHDYSNPAPTTVTHDHGLCADGIWVDTTIIDTIQVERVDGSNCLTAADGFCDTSPDYLSSRWNCNGDGLSPTLQTDPNGETFRSDGSYIMGYANDACQAIFTPDQIAAMRAFLLAEREEWLYDQTPAFYLSGPAQMTGPETATLHPANQVTLSWTAVPEAEGYLVEVSRLSGFVGGLTEEYVTTDTSLLVPDLAPNRTYYWRVRPYNRYDGCQGFAEVRNFQTDATVHTETITPLDQWRVYPNPLGPERQLVLDLQLSDSWTGEWRLTNALGQLVRQGPLNLANGQSTHTLSLNDLPAGWYQLQLTDGQQQLTTNIIAQ
ncbi:MAG: T9SS type A sorting domain-containing protein [Lewinella sp.]|nr:T9SS type A sorting domain-containing protein [Lewinella sp.]